MVLIPYRAADYLQEALTNRMPRDSQALCAPFTVHSILASLMGWTLSQPAYCFSSS